MIGDDLVDTARSDLIERMKTVLDHYLALLAGHLEHRAGPDGSNARAEAQRAVDQARRISDELGIGPRNRTRGYSTGRGCRMIEFPGTEKEVRQLERFLTATENAPSSAELDDMRARALAHAERLSNAVSIGFAGEFGAG